MTFENVGPRAPPGWELAPFNGSPPASITLAVFDADGPTTDDNGNGTNQDELTSVAQPADLVPGPGRSVTIDLEPLINGPNTMLNFEGEDVRMSVTIGVELRQGLLTSLSAPSQFRPSSGERATILAGASGGPRLELTAYGPGTAGIVWRQTAQVPASPVGQTQGVSFEWNGLGANGLPLPAGNYVIEVRGVNPAVASGATPTPRDLTTPASRTVTVTVLAPLPTPTLTLLAMDPGQQWAPETGPLQLRVISNQGITVTTQVFVGSSCASGAPLLIALPSQGLMPVTERTIGWDGTTPSGAPVAPARRTLNRTLASLGLLSS